MPFPKLLGLLLICSQTQLSNADSSLPPPENMLDIPGLPLHSSVVHSHVFQYTVQQAELEHPSWQDVDEICFNFTKEATVYATDHSTEVPMETLTVCSRLSEYPFGIKEHLELKTKAKYHYTVVLKSKSGSPVWEFSTSFEYRLSDSCRRALGHGTTHLHNQYHGAVLSPYNRDELSPLCYEEYGSSTGGDLETFDMLSTASGFRGSFGTDHTQQEFGHGDTMVLQFVLSRFRHITNMVELGTCGGITSFHFGVAAALRGGGLWSVDIHDLRPPNVASAWLPNMHFLVSDVNQPTAELVERVREADLLFVDAAHDTRFQQATQLAPLMKLGSVVVVHDFPAELSESEWVEGMAKVGFVYIYQDVTAFTKSSVGVFRSVTSPAAAAAGPAPIGGVNSEL